jgi:roadblock/LC7 domain-containing protein
MITSTRASLTTKIAVLVASLACASLLAGAVAARAATIIYAPESFTEYEHQLAGGKIKAVTVNKRVRSLRVTLTDGRYVLARYKPKEEEKAVAVLQAKHVPVTVLMPAEASKEFKAQPKKPVKHKLRYIAAGVLIVVIIIVGAVLLIRRRRYRDEY